MQFNYHDWFEILAEIEWLNPQNLDRWRYFIRYRYRHQYEGPIHSCAWCRKSTYSYILPPFQSPYNTYPVIFCSEGHADLWVEECGAQGLRKHYRWLLREQIESMLDQGLPPKEIYKKIGKSTYRGIAKRYNIKVVYSWEDYNRVYAKNIKHKRVVEKKSDKQIAHELDIDPSTVRRIRELNNIPPLVPRAYTEEEKQDFIFMAFRYMESAKCNTIRAASELIGIPYVSLRSILKEAGHSFRRRITPEMDEQIRQAILQGKTKSKVCKEFGIGGSTWQRIRSQMRNYQPNKKHY